MSIKVTLAKNQERCWHCVADISLGMALLSSGTMSYQKLFLQTGTHLISFGRNHKNSLLLPRLLKSSLSWIQTTSH